MTVRAWLRAILRVDPWPADRRTEVLWCPDGCVRVWHEGLPDHLVDPRLPYVRAFLEHGGGGR